MNEKISSSWKSYLEYLSEAETKNWNQEYWKFLNSKFFESNKPAPFPDALITIHPKWHVTVTGGNKECPVRGPRTFTDQAAEKTLCNSKKFWGYECPFIHNPQLSKDHIFPYSKGGPTSATYNFTWLCKMHNEMKSGDIHVVDLRKKPNWFDEQYQKVKARMALI